MDRSRRRGRGYSRGTRRLASIRVQKTLGGAEKPKFMPRQVKRGESKAKASEQRSTSALPSFLKTEVHKEPSPSSAASRNRGGPSRRSRRGVSRSAFHPSGKYGPGPRGRRRGGFGGPKGPGGAGARAVPRPVRNVSGAFAHGPSSGLMADFELDSDKGSSALHKERRKGNTMDDIAPHNPFRPVSLPFRDLNASQPNDKRQDDAPVDDQSPNSDVAQHGVKVKTEMNNTDAAEDSSTPMDVEEPSASAKEKADAPSQAPSQKKDPFDTASHFAGDAAMDDSLCFVQLPTHLPTKDSLKQSPTLSTPMGPFGEMAEETQLFEPNVGKVASGHVGKILVYKSGKVKMRMGNMLYDISNGTECGFMQEVAVIDPEEERFVVLGEVEHRFLCTPDVEHMLMLSPGDQSPRSTV